MERKDKYTQGTIQKDKLDPTIEDANQKIDLSLDSHDQLKIAGLAKLNAQQNFRQRAMVAERKRLIKKYGAKHPRVQKVAAKLKFNDRFISDIRIEKDKANIVPPTTGKDTWLLHGRVLDQDNIGIKGLTVSLFNRKNKWVRELGFACTDELGYFAIIYRQESEKTNIPGSQELILTVTDEENRILHQEKDQLMVSIGKIDYREIVLSKSDQTCTEPEPGDVDPVPKDEIWAVQGRVRDNTDQPMPGLTVNLYDKDLLFDEKLGNTKTDKEGIFRFSYKTKDFPDLIEKNPDIYLKVTDAKGKSLYVTRKAIHFVAGKKEVFNIKL